MGRVRKAICAPENTGGKLKMGKWQRSLYQPVLPLGKDGKRVTGSAEHIALSRKAAGEGMVLVKNENDTLPLAKGTKVALFGKGTIDYVKGGGGSGDVTVEYIRNFYEGMKIKEAEGEVSLFHELPEFYEKNGRAGNKSESIYRYRNHHHLPFLRRGLGPQMPDQR